MVITSAMGSVSFNLLLRCLPGSRREGPFSDELSGGVDQAVARSRPRGSTFGDVVVEALRRTWLLMMVERLPWRSSRTSKRSRRSASVIGVIAKSSITRTSARAISRAPARTSRRRVRG